jgi:hypothetical protein
MAVTVTWGSYTNPEYIYVVGVSSNGALTSNSFNASSTVSRGGVNNAIYNINIASLSGSYYVYAFLQSDYNDTTYAYIYI